MVELNFYFISSRKDIKQSEDWAGILLWRFQHGHFPLALEFSNTGNIYFFLEIMKQEDLDKDFSKLIDAINHEVIENLTANEHLQNGFHSILNSIGLKDLIEYILPLNLMIKHLKK